LPSKAPYLLRGTVRHRANIESLPHQLLVDHPHDRPIRRNRQVDPLFGGSEAAEMIGTVRRPVSALPPKADKREKARLVRFVPKVD
jgi:hypothetical protein